jgi:hypothetical protein
LEKKMADYGGAMSQGIMRGLAIRNMYDQSVKHSQDTEFTDGLRKEMSIDFDADQSQPAQVDTSMSSQDTGGIAPAAMPDPDQAPGNLAEYGIAPAVQANTPPAATIPQPPKVKGPDFDKALSAYERGIKYAMKNGRMDETKKLMGEAIQMRGAVRSHLLDEADRSYMASNKQDLSGYEKAYNYFPDGQNVKLQNRPDGSVHAAFTTADGKTFESVVPQAEVPKYIAMLRDPDTVRKTEAAWAQKVLESDLKIKENAAGERVKGEEARKTEKLKQEGESFTHMPGTDGEPGVIYSKRTGDVKGGGRGVAPAARQPGFNRKDLPVHKETRDIIEKMPGMIAVDELTGEKTLTEEGSKKLFIAGNLTSYAMNETGEKMNLSPAEIATWATKGELSKNPVVVDGGDGKYYEVPTVSMDGQQMFLGDKRSWKDVTKNVKNAARDSQTAKQFPGPHGGEESRAPVLNPAKPAGAAPAKPAGGIAPAAQRPAAMSREEARANARSDREAHASRQSSLSAEREARAEAYRQKSQDLGRQLVEAKRTGDTERVRALIQEQLNMQRGIQ